MDLSKLQAKSRVFDVVHPQNYQPIGLKIHLRPAESDEVRKVSRQQQNARLASRKQRVTAEQVEAENTNLLIAAIEGWTFGVGADGDTLTIDGDTPAFTPEAARSLFKRWPFIQRQVLAELADDGAFYQD